MGSMFNEAKTFNGDISKWDVSRVKDMGSMFDGAVSFSQTLCGAWRDSKAKKTDMFRDSNGKLCSSSYAFYVIHLCMYFLYAFLVCL